jgi:hypothetical protein
MRFTQHLLLFLLGSLTVAASNLHAESKSKPASQAKIKSIPFYLPIDKTQFPGLIEKIEKVLSVAGLGHLKITTTSYWHPYQNGIRQGRMGIYLAAPHFASWLINQHQFNTELKLAGSLRYVIAVRRADTSIFEVNDLVNKTVCTSAIMDLSFLLATESTPHSLLSAKTRRVESVVEQMRLNSRKCNAFSLSEHLFLEIAAEQPFKFIGLKQSAEFSNYAYLVHPDVSQQTSAALTKFLKNKEVAQILLPIHQLFAAEPRLVRARPNHYPRSQLSPLLQYWAATQ